MRLILIVAALVALALGRPAAAFERVGIVLLHGKTGTPDQFETLANTLIEAGIPVEAPEMCWSAERLYDAAFADCMKDVDTAIGYLREDGITRIVVGGHSLGALGALGYAAIGAYSMRVDSFLLAFLGAMIVPGLAMLAGRVWLSGRR